MVKRALILLLPLTAAAQIEEIPIKLVGPRVVSATVMCEVDGTYFHISRTLLDKDITITARNGMKLVLPWQAGECEEHTAIWRNTSQ